MSRRRVGFRVTPHTGRVAFVTPTGGLQRPGYFYVTPTGGLQRPGYFYVTPMGGRLARRKRPR
eukprot:445515-Prorocentrum_minimum.AAC.1